MQPLPAGTQVVTRVPVGGARGVIPAGSVAVVAEAPRDATHSYRVRFADGFEAALKRSQLTLLSRLKEGGLLRPDVLADHDLRAHVVYRCVVGSRAYGLAHEGSDVDRRGIYLPPAELHWSLYGVPEQLEDGPAQECLRNQRGGFPSDGGVDSSAQRRQWVDSAVCGTPRSGDDKLWELQKFLVLALKANPNVLECLWTPLVEEAAPVAQELLAMRGAFLSRLVYQTYNGYVMSQLEKMRHRLRRGVAPNWKHAMHLIRLLHSGITILREGRVPVRVERERDRLLAIRAGEVAWDEVDSWRKELHQEFERAYATTALPERPDYAAADAFLVRARRSMVR